MTIVTSLQAEDIADDATSGLIDIDAEWSAISAGESNRCSHPRVNRITSTHGLTGTHAPTGVSGYRTLIEAALADDRYSDLTAPSFDNKQPSELPFAMAGLT